MDEEEEKPGSGAEKYSVYFSAPDKTYKRLFLKIFLNDNCWRNIYTIGTYKKIRINWYCGQGPALAVVSNVPISIVSRYYDCSGRVSLGSQFKMALDDAPKQPGIMVKPIWSQHQTLATYLNLFLELLSQALRSWYSYSKIPRSVIFLICIHSLYCTTSPSLTLHITSYHWTFHLFSSLTRKRLCVVSLLQAALWLFY